MDNVMKISINLGYISNNCDWKKFCEITGTDYYCMNEGANADEMIQLTQEQAIAIGLIKE